MVVDGPAAENFRPAGGGELVADEKLWACRSRPGDRSCRIRLGARVSRTRSCEARINAGFGLSDHGRVTSVMCPLGPGHQRFDIAGFDCRGAPNAQAGRGVSIGADVVGDASFVEQSGTFGFAAFARGASFQGLATKVKRPSNRSTYWTASLISRDSFGSATATDEVSHGVLRFACDRPNSAGRSADTFRPIAIRRAHRRRPAWTACSSCRRGRCLRSVCLLLVRPKHFRHRPQTLVGLEPGDRLSDNASMRALPQRRVSARTMSRHRACPTRHPSRTPQIGAQIARP